jgi:phosphate transport system substrate-binding protein
MQLTCFFKTCALAVATALTGSSAAAAEITGAGATFPYPIYASWAQDYKKLTGTSLNYQSIGSGAGIKQIKSKTVDFGASDRPLKAEDLEKEGLMQFPAIMGAVAPVVNLKGIGPGQLKMTGPVLADIFLGKITKWNASEIAALNPGVNLPAEDIVVVRRSDGSGTTFLFTDYLSKVSPDFKAKVGGSTAVRWPVGIGGKGNEGVSAYVQRIKNSIGYLEYNFIKHLKMSHMQLQNREGQFVHPGDESVKAAASNADWTQTPGFGAVLTNQPGKDSWPITGASFILMHKVQMNPTRAKEVLTFFDWAYKNGSGTAAKLNYVAIPAPLVNQVQDAWKSQMKDGFGKAVW